MNISKELKDALVAACVANGLQSSTKYAMLNEEQRKDDERRIVAYVGDFAQRVDMKIKSHLEEICFNRDDCSGFIYMKLTNDDAACKEYIIEAISEFFHVAMVSWDELRIWWNEEMWKISTRAQIKNDIEAYKKQVSYYQCKLDSTLKIVNSLLYKLSLFKTNYQWRIDLLKKEIAKNQEEVARLEKQLTLV